MNISTIIVWNDKELCVRRVTDKAADALCEEIRRRLHGEAGENWDYDVRWQIVYQRLSLDVDLGADEGA